MKKRISVLFAATILILTIVVEPAFAYRLSRPMCHYHASYGDYVLGWDSRHLRHANDYRANWDPDYREYYCDDYASAAFFGSSTATATSTASATATATSTALATTGGPSYVPALASAAALALLGSGLLALRLVLGRRGAS
jgi:hypothetical protein